jgi:hypothetical protein
MSSKNTLIVGALVAFWLFGGIDVFAAAKLDTVTVGYSTFAGAYVPFLWPLRST